jgi:hypothetical protein
LAASMSRRVMSMSSLLGVGSPRDAMSENHACRAFCNRFSKHDGRVHGAGVEQAARGLDRRFDEPVFGVEQLC